MELFKSKGIVLKVIKYGETSIITQIFTREMGLRSFIISGARKPKATISASLFQHGNMLQFVAYNKPNGQLARIKEVSPSYYYQEVPYKVEKSTMVIFLLEVVAHSIKQEERDTALFDFLENRLIQLDTISDGLSCFHLKFMVDFSGALGFQPMGNFSSLNCHFNLDSGNFNGANHSPYALNEEKSQFLYQLICAGENELPSLKIQKKIRIELLKDLIQYFHFHIEGFKEIRSLEILQKIF